VRVAPGHEARGLRGEMGRRAGDDALDADRGGRSRPRRAPRRLPGDEELPPRTTHRGRPDQRAAVTSPVTKVIRCARLSRVTVTVVGLGYVGCVVAGSLASKGVVTYGVEVQRDGL